MDAVCGGLLALKGKCPSACSPFCDEIAPLTKRCSEVTSRFPVWASALLIGLLVLLSGLFSGLTLGLLSLSLRELQVLVKAKRPRIETFAKRILLVRRHGNWLLCTLLLGNVATNAALTVLVDDLFADKPGMGLLLSTTLISFFGEILPQAVCSRNALVVGYYSFPAVILFMALLAPVAWPLGRLFDWLLGADMGVLYNNAELRELIEMHISMEKAELGEEQGRIIRGAFDFFKLSVADVMTPWGSVFRLSVGTRLDFDTLHRIFQLGFSRIPVVDGGDRVVGALFVKDLVLLDPEDGLAVEEVARLYGRRLGVVRMDDSVRFVMAGFAAGHTHMALVLAGEAPELKGGEVVPGVVGIITLEDIVEKILNFDIVDETDVQKNPVKREPFDLTKLHVFDYRRELPKEHLLPQEVPLIAKALAESGAVCAQRSPPLSLRTLKMLLRLSKVKRVQLGTDRKGDALVLEGGPVLYRRGEEYGYCYFLLEGEASEDGGGRRVTAGTTVGAEALARLEGGKGFVAAVGVRLTTDARVVLISRLDLDEILELQVKEGA